MNIQKAGRRRTPAVLRQRRWLGGVVCPETGGAIISSSSELIIQRWLYALMLRVVSDLPEKLRIGTSASPPRVVFTFICVVDALPKALNVSMKGIRNKTSNFCQVWVVISPLSCSNGRSIREIALRDLCPSFPVRLHGLIQDRIFAKGPSGPVDIGIHGFTPPARAFW